MKKIFILFLFAPLVIHAQQTTTGNEDSLFIKSISDNIFLSQSCYNNLWHLTKKIGGRLAGSPQTYLAEQWGAEVLKNSGASQVILQECMVPHWVRGGTDKTEIFFTDAVGKKQKMSLNVLALGNSVGTGKKGIEAPLIRVNNFDELEKKKDEIKNKIVFYNCPFEQTYIQTFDAYRHNAVYRGSGPSRAAKYGAFAVIIRSMTNGEDNDPHTGSLRYTDSIKKIPAVAVGLRDMEKMNEVLDKNIPVTASMFTYGYFLNDTIAHNVIGELKGSRFPDEIITVGGHLDSWDVNEGAHDDGAGVVQTIEVLRALVATGYKPEHTIRFVLFANEENGLRGGAKYAEEAASKNEKHIFALESDAGGFTPRGFGFSVPDSVWAKIYSWRYLFEPYGGSAFTKGGGGADIGPLQEKFKTPLAGLQPDSQRYFDIHHAAGDIFENVNIRELKLGAVNMAALIYLVDKYGL